MRLFGFIRSYSDQPGNCGNHTLFAWFLTGYGPHYWKERPGHLRPGEFHGEEARCCHGRSTRGARGRCGGRPGCGTAGSEHGPWPVSTATARVALVTGAASGIGAAVSRALRSGGWRVAGLDLGEPDADLSVTGDVTDPEAVTWAVSQARDRLGPVDALVSAAGYYEMLPVEAISAAQWQKMLRLHLGGLANTTRAVLPGMLSRGAGHIVAISSELAVGGGDGDAHYAAAKGAVLGFVRSLAAEVAGRGVQVNSVAPGPTDTPLLAPDSPWRAPEYLATLPARRLARPDEIAAAVRFVLEEGSFLAGEVLSVNSGAVI